MRTPVARSGVAGGATEIISSPGGTRTAGAFNITAYNIIMAKKLVVCCDGTGNEYGSRNSNVVKLYSMLEKNTREQLAFYDPGVGTFSVRPSVTRIMQGFWRAMGLGFGLGITQNILDAYTFIMQNYLEGDSVYIFGFSRGAYTARAVAGMLHKCGVLGTDNYNLLPYAMRIFKHERDPAVVDGFKRTFARPVAIHFLGLWDTVTSVGWFWEPARFPYTTTNPSVSIVRQAVAIDERRAFYRQNLWKDSPGQDVRQVWFAGAHSDVGGSYPEQESGLSKLALEWMIAEAYGCGLRLDRQKAIEVVNDAPAPDYRAEIHKSLHSYWWPMELWPKIIDYEKNGSYRWRPHANLGRRRHIGDDVLLHESVAERLKDGSLAYAPSNIPLNYSVEPRRKLEDVLGEGL